jgi:hypothetical protein
MKKTTGRRPVRTTKKSVAVKKAKAHAKSIRKPLKKVALKRSVSKKGPDATLFPYAFERHADLPFQMTRMKRYAEKLGKDGSELVLKAYAFADERHKGLLRDGDSPYIIHLIRTANILLAEWSERDPNVIAAALLHDVIEDTHTTSREVKDFFGSEIAKITDGMTMWKGSESPEAYFQRISKGPGILRRVKCADVIDNLRSWHECSMETAEHFSTWWRMAKTYGIPMAESLQPSAAVMLKKIVENPWYLRRAGMI